MIAFQLNPKSGVPIYRQIQDLVRYGIASGLLTAGEQLPTVRSLAVELSVNPNTVIKAYSELEREGVLTTEQGSGTFVAAQPPSALPTENRQAKLESLCSEFLSQVARFGFTPQDIVLTIDRLLERRTPA
jgi:GntR family transcriptional regulator